MYLSAYWIVSRSLSSLRDQRRFLTGIALLSVVLSLTTVVFAAGWVSYDQAVLANRLAGALQYPNTLAAYLLLGAGLLAAFRANAQQVRDKVLWGLGLYANGVIFLFTYSRLAYLVTVPVGMLYLLLAPRGKRAALITGIVPAVLGVLSVAVPIDAVLKGQAFSALPLWFGLGALVTGVLELGWHLMISNRLLFRAAVGTGALGVLGVSIYIGPKAVGLLQRIQSISLTDVSAVLRLLTYRSALEAWWQEGPLLGLGGGGWRAVYLAYRFSTHTSRTVHSTLVETLAEVGLVGALVLLAVWFSALYLAWQVYRRSAADETKLLWLGGAMGLLGLLLHSQLDFDLWFPAVSLPMFALLGVIRSAGGAEWKEKQRQRTALNLSRGLQVAAALLLLVTFSLMLSQRHHAAALALQRRGDIAGAEAAVRRAMTFDPLNGALHTEYARLLLARGLQRQDQNLLTAARNHLNWAVSLDSFNPAYRLERSHYFYLTQNCSAAVADAEEATRLDPFTLTTYHRTARQAFLCMNQAIVAQDLETAGAYHAAMGRILQQFEDTRLDQQADPFQQYLKPHWLRADPLIDVLRAQHLAFEGRPEQALELVLPHRKTRDIGQRKEVLLWSGVFALVSGREDLWQQTRAELEALDPALTDQIGREAEVLMYWLNNRP